MRELILVLGNGFAERVKLIDKFLNKLNNFRDKVIQRFFIPLFPLWLKPNHLSTLRIIFSPILVFLVWINIYPEAVKTLFIMIVATDILDGPLARARKQYSKWGGFLDGFSDKILICPLAFLLLSKYDWWLVVFICLNDAISLLLAAFAFKNKLEIKANILGKYKMVFQSIGIASLILWPSNLATNIKLLWFALGLGVGSVILHCHNYLNASYCRVSHTRQ